MFIVLELEGIYSTDVAALRTREVQVFFLLLLFLSRRREVQGDSSNNNNSGLLGPPPGPSLLLLVAVIVWAEAETTEKGLVVVVSWRTRDARVPIVFFFPFPVGFFLCCC